MPRGPFAFHEMVSLGALCGWSLFVGLGWAILCLVNHAFPHIPFSPYTKRAGGLRPGENSFVCVRKSHNKLHDVVWGFV